MSSRSLWLAFFLFSVTNAFAQSDDVLARIPKVFRATKACKEGMESFPFLKPWIEKLDNFIAPVEIGSTEGSLFYAIGATTMGAGAAELWRKDSTVLDLDWRHKGGWQFQHEGGSVEEMWLGEFPQKLPKVAPGPGTAPLKQGAGDFSQMGAGRSTKVVQGTEELSAYAIDAIKAAGSDKGWERFWSLLWSKGELELLKNCTPKDCKIKFDDNELKKIAGASNQYRIDQFRLIIETRIAEYQKQGFLRAYEGTSAPMDWEDLPVHASLPKELNTHFYQSGDKKSFGYDSLDPEPGKHKPVLGLYSRQCSPRVFRGKTYTACSDLVLYNNHYFDFWGRLVYFFPWCGVNVVLVYETMDVDQVKDSRFARILFGGEMRKLIGLLLESRLRRLHMLGS